MNQQLYINGFQTVLAAALSAGATQMTLAAGQGQLLRNAGVGNDGDYVRVELTQAAAPESSWERIYITSVVGDVANILRNRDGNKALSWPSGSAVRSYNRQSQQPPIVATSKTPNTQVLEEGMALSVNGSADAAGTITVYAQNYFDIDTVFSINAGRRIIGPYSGKRKVVVNLTAGSVDVNEVIGARGPAGQDIAFLHMGQSTELGGCYPQLTYTSGSASGNGTTATLTTSMANNLPIGDVVLGRVSGMTPSGYNTSGNVAMLVGGVWPNSTLTYTSTGTGAQTVAGTITIDQEATSPQTFGSQRLPGQKAPYLPALTYTGGYLSGVMDMLYDAGYNAHVINAGIGGVSLVQHICGQLSSYATAAGTGTAGQHFRVRRPPAGNGDLGCLGSLILGPGTNALFECTAGGDEVYAYYNGAQPIKVSASGSAYMIDYIQTVAKGNGSAATPDTAWAGKTVGQIVTDGDLTWTCISANTTTDPDLSIRGTTGFTPFSETRYGFDPFGILKRAFAEGERAAQGKVQKIVYWANAQSDTAAAQSWYQAAVTAFANYACKRGWKVAFGISIFNPATAGANYDKLQAAIDAALPALRTAWPNKVFLGANLSTDPSIGRVHGAGNLYLESDNSHVGENIHPQARTSRAAVPLVAAAVLAALAS